MHAEEEERQEVRRQQWEAKQVDPVLISEFQQLQTQMTTFYDEFSILSKKSPNDPLNKFKLKFVNDTLKKANSLLAEAFRPFPDFETFPDEDLPTNSDAVLMLSQYLKSMERFKSYHSTSDMYSTSLLSGYMSNNVNCL